MTLLAVLIGIELIFGVCCFLGGAAYAMRRFGISVWTSSASDMIQRKNSER